MMSFPARLISLTMILHVAAYRVGNQALQVDNSLVRAGASASSAAAKISEASDRRMLLAMWNDIVDALRHTATGAGEALTFAASLNDRYSQIDSMISENNLGTIIGGEFTVADMKSIDDGPLILEIKGLLSAFFHDVTLAVDATVTLLDTMSKAVDLVQEVPEFSPAGDVMITHDIDSLKGDVSSLNSTYYQESVCEQIGETLGPLLVGWQGLTAWGQARRVARGGEPLRSSLRTLSEVKVSLSTAHQTGEVQDLVNTTFRLANSMLDATHNIENLEDRVFGATEIIDRDLCEWEPTHNFFITREVDDDTMSCEDFSFIARKTCRCRNPTDCYVTSENRPPPSDMKRCFRPLRRASETVDRTVCAPEAEHTFSSSEVVDLETMECRVGYFRQTCSCQFPDDCYVRDEHRPEPSDRKRCFRPVNVTEETFDVISETLDSAVMHLPR